MPSTPTLTLLTPNGGEHWRLGETRQISWDVVGAYNHTPLQEGLTIELLQNGSVVGVIASGIDASTETYNWTVGRLADGRFITGSDLNIRIRATIDAAPTSRRKK